MKYMNYLVLLGLMFVTSCTKMTETYRLSCVDSLQPKEELSFVSSHEKKIERTFWSAMGVEVANSSSEKEIEACSLVCNRGATVRTFEPFSAITPESPSFVSLMSYGISRYICIPDVKKCPATEISPAKEVPFIGFDFDQAISFDLDVEVGKGKTAMDLLLYQSCEEEDNSPVECIEPLVRNSVTNTCVNSELMCTGAELLGLDGADNVVKMFNTETNEYGACMIKSCQANYNFNETTGTCILDMCAMNPTMPGCAGFDPCTLNPAAPECNPEPPVEPDACLIDPFSIECTCLANPDDPSCI